MMMRPTASDVSGEELTGVHPRGKPGFEEFFRRSYLRLGRTLYLLSGSHEEAEDLAQEALIKVYARWDRVQRMDSPDGYLYRVAVNLYRRSQRASSRSVIALETVPVKQVDAMAVDDIDQVDAEVDLLRILQALPAEQREALVLVEWLGLDSATASSLLGIASASVRGRVFRARRALRRKFGVDLGGVTYE